MTATQHQSLSSVERETKSFLFVIDKLNADFQIVDASIDGVQYTIVVYFFDSS